MITVDELRDLQVRFEEVRTSDKPRYRELEKIRREFVSRFPSKRIALLSLDQYVEGKSSKESFCYWVEWKTSGLGRIQGSPSIKFGVFFSPKANRYQFTSKFKDEHTAVKFMRDQIVRLLEAGRAGDLNTIRRIEISPMFKGKILFLYYPDRFLNVLSEKHVDHFLRETGLVVPSDDFDVLAKREFLHRFKADDEVMSKWTTNEFMRFLYYTWPPPPKASKVSPVLRKYVEAANFPLPQKTKAEFISFELGRGSDSGNQTRELKTGAFDFDAQNQRNKRIGDQGEEVVYWSERRWLEDQGRKDLALRVEPAYKNDPGAGYDIKSFELDDRPKYIEVKSTTGRPPVDASDVPFYLSAREYEQAQKLPNFYLFIVFDVKSLHPKIWRIPEPAKLVPEFLVLKTSIYRATVTTSVPKTAT